MRKKSVRIGIGFGMGVVGLIVLMGLFLFGNEIRSHFSRQQTSPKPPQQTDQPAAETNIPPQPSKPTTPSQPTTPSTPPSQQPPSQQLPSTQGENGSFAIRGVIEGFYGTPWMNTQREDMLHFMGAHHFNTYVYAPKDDPYQRLQWGDLYPAASLQQMRDLVQSASGDGISFVYSISPGIPEPLPNQTADPKWETSSITFTSQSDRDRLVAKINQLRSIGVHTFMLSFDDVEHHLKRADQQTYGSNYAQAPIDLANQLLQEEQRIDPAFHLWFAPTTYYGVQDNPYWSAIRSSLNPSIQVIWTGKWVLNASIESSQAQTVTELLGRKPLLWDNFPVNDWTYAVNNAPQLLMGPLENRASDLGDHVTGLIANPMIQPEASKVSLATIGDYLHNARSYQPQVSWQAAIQSVNGVGDQAAFQTFCSYSEESSFRDVSNPAFVALSDAFWKERATGGNGSQAAQLRQELQRVSDLPNRLHRSMQNTAMLNEIDPWLIKLGQEGQAGVLALDYLQTPPSNAKHSQLHQELASQLKQIKSNNLYIGREIVSFLDKALAQ